MIKNYFIIAWRNLRKNKLTSFINIFSLTLSISICILIALFIFDETHYDNFQKDHQNIFRLESTLVSETKTTKWAATPAPFKRMFEQSCPEVEAAARIFSNMTATTKIGEKKFREEHCFWSDPSVIDVLGLTLLKGNLSRVLADPNSVVLTESTAIRYFGSTEVLNKTLLINDELMKVTGLIKDLPVNSHMKIDLIPSLYPILKAAGNKYDKDWASGFYTYIKLKPNTDVKKLEKALPKRFEKQGMPWKEDVMQLRLHAIDQIHLDGNREKEMAQNSDWIFVYIFSTVGFLILLLASINYINLSTSSSIGRSKEISVRKTLGAMRSGLIVQFLTESVVITSLSFCLALICISVSLPIFNSITGKAFQLSSLITPFFLKLSFFIIFFVGILGGLYPAFFLSSYNAALVLKGITKNKFNSFLTFGLKKGLVVFQFVITVVLLISSQMVINQINYIFNKPLGYNKDNILVIPIQSFSSDQFARFKNDLAKNISILNVSASSSIPGKRIHLQFVQYENGPVDVKRAMGVEQDYIKTMKMDIVSGRDFDKAISSDTTQGFIINESSAKSLGWDQPLGKAIALDDGQFKKGKVIGVIKDFHQGSMHTIIEPVVLYAGSSWFQYVIVKTKQSLTEKTKNEIKVAWENSFTNQAFSYTFLEDELKTLYRAETTLKTLMIIFTFFAILIALMGLFCLIHFSTITRRREIGLRKVLGANNKSLIYLLSKEYLILVAIAILISIPLSIYILKTWLMNFAYRTEISLTIFVNGITLTLLIAFTTLLIQILKAANSNTVTNLRTE